MSKIEMEFVGFNNFQNCIAIDGKIIKTQKSNKKNVYTFESVKENAHVTIYKTHQFVGKHWLWWNLLFFFVSIFGLFDIRHNKRCSVFEGDFVISTEKDCKFVIRKKEFQDGGGLFEVEGITPIKEISNTQYYDKTGQSRYKKMKKIKVGIIVTVCVLSVFVIILI